jgi:hypothetical protein
MSRLHDLDAFYGLLNDLSRKVGGYRMLRDCAGKSGWPQRGLYFFFEEGELRERSKQLRVVRVGTHAVTATSRTTLWNRLHTHRGHTDGGGNHRGSIFRKRIGEALLQRSQYSSEIQQSWGRGSTAPKAVRLAETRLENDVSQYVGRMPFLWLDVNDAPSPNSHRSCIERNCIALLSNYRKPPIDPASKRWLGNHSTQETIRDSGLWNTNYVEGGYDPAFLTLLRSYVKRTS